VIAGLQKPLTKPAESAKLCSMIQKQRTSLLNKLESVSKITDRIELSPSEACEILRRYHPDFSNINGSDDLNQSPVPFSGRYFKLISYFTDEEGSVRKRYATQVFLAIALAARNKARADSDKRIIHLINKVVPGVVGTAQIEEFIQQTGGLSKNERKSKKSKNTRHHWQSYDHEFIWYARHTLGELESAIQIHRDTIRKKFKAKKKIKMSRQWMFHYSPAECLKILNWWLGEYLPKKTNKDRDFALVAGKLILHSLSQQDLSEAAKEKVAQAIEDACGHEVRYPSGISSILASITLRNGQSYF